MSRIAQAFDFSCDRQWEAMNREALAIENAEEAICTNMDFYAADFVSESICEAKNSVWDAISAALDAGDDLEVGVIVRRQYERYRKEWLDAKVSEYLEKVAA